MNRNQIRIISGQWRGRKITFEDLPGLRPTPDRVRETLFNWLGGRIVDAQCLDLFAGSGALSFEALSRGANKVMALDKNVAVINHIKENAAVLKTDRIEIIQADSLRWLENTNKNRNANKDTKTVFDIIFVDPPFSEKILIECIQSIMKNAWLKDNGLIYFESGTELLPEMLPADLKIFRIQKAGQVYFGLLQVVAK